MDQRLVRSLTEKYALNFRLKVKPLSAIKCIFPSRSTEPATLTENQVLVSNSQITARNNLSILPKTTWFPHYLTEEMHHERGWRECLRDNKRAFKFYHMSDLSWFLTANSRLQVMETSLWDRSWMLIQALLSPPISSEGSCEVQWMIARLDKIVLPMKNHPIHVYVLK